MTATHLSPKFVQAPAPKPLAQSHAMHSEALLRGQKAVGILHNGNLYKLQATKLGKLILTK
jgi:hemin uptake protein HemP